MESTPLLFSQLKRGSNVINARIKPTIVSDGPTRRRNNNNENESIQNQIHNNESKHFGNNDIFEEGGIDDNHYYPSISKNGTKDSKKIQFRKNISSFVQRISTSANVIKDMVPTHHGISSLGIMDGTAYNNRNKGTDYNNDIYYEDHFNELPWKFSFGTSQEDGVWMNTSDGSGIIMASMVWIMILYSGFTVTILAQNNALSSVVAIIYCTLCALALASHAKTTFTDPGSIPHSAVPNEDDGGNHHEFPMCSVCETYKPKYCHHCRICNRCISGMDHHCPWMNNCIGKGNLKHFTLFLVYVWLASAYALVLFGLNYFLCNREECTFPDVLVQLVRIMTVLCIGAFYFTSNMIISVLWGIVTGLGIIDRMKGDAVQEAPIPWKDVFGIQHYFTWLLPIDPVFEDYDRVMKYSTVPRLLREKKMEQ